MKCKAAFLLPALLLVGVVTAVVIALSFHTPDKRLTGDDDLKSGKYLLTVDGFGVTEEEFLLFLSGEKASTANHYWAQYGLQPDAAFWTTPVEGQTPLQYAKVRALAALTRSKEEFLLAAERGILPYRDHDGFLAELEAENARRAEKRAAGEVVYGPMEFSPLTYYQYLSGNLRSQLYDSQLALAKPSQKDLEQLYGENKDRFDLGTVYTCQVLYRDGSKETLTLDSMDIGKSDEIAQVLLQKLETMAVGTVADNLELYRGTARVTLKRADHQGYVPFADAQDTLTSLYAQQELEKLLTARTQSASIAIDTARYDAVSMP